MTAAQLAGLLDLVPDRDSEMLAALVDGQADIDIILTRDGEAAYQRYATRANRMWTLVRPARPLPVLIRGGPGPMTDFAADITARARWAQARNDGHPEPAWSTGERLIVALVLGDQATLDSEGYTRQQVLQRLSGDLAFYGCTVDAETWITGIRAAL